MLSEGILQKIDNQIYLKVIICNNRCDRNITFKEIIFLEKQNKGKKTYSNK